ncbi:MAG: aminodeoxychorismate synthase component I, partial [Bacteroidales bacterium]
MNRQQDPWIRMDELGSQRAPFLFIIDFEMVRPMVFPLHALPAQLCFSTPGMPEPFGEPGKAPFDFIREPVHFEEYRKAFQIVIKQILHGNSYLVNLTFPTPIRTNLSLREIYHQSQAPYRLLVGDRFTVFSPEPFITISDGVIRTFPMKGTIDASVKEAEQVIMQNVKEMAEHHTIVDLLRNDLSRVAGEVTVRRFRYVDRIRAHDREILQVSSEISGRLFPGFPSTIGQIIRQLLPAGSVSGAPKKKTLEIIREAEGSPRGYYTGVFGVFDGQ